MSNICKDCKYKTVTIITINKEAQLVYVCKSVGYKRQTIQEGIKENNPYFIGKAMVDFKGQGINVDEKAGIEIKECKYFKVN